MISAQTTDVSAGASSIQFYNIRVSGLNRAILQMWCKIHSCLYVCLSLHPFSTNQINHYPFYKSRISHEEQIRECWDCTNGCCSYCWWGRAVISLEIVITTIVIVGGNQQILTKFNEYILAILPASAI